MMQRVVRVRDSSCSYCVLRRGSNQPLLLVCSWSTEEYRLVVRTSWLREIQNRFRVRFGEYWALFATAPFAPIRWRW